MLVISIHTITKSLRDYATYELTVLRDVNYKGSF